MKFVHMASERWKNWGMEAIGVTGVGLAARTAVEVVAAPADAVINFFRSIGTLNLLTIANTTIHTPVDLYNSYFANGALGLLSGAVFAGSMWLFGHGFAENKVVKMSSH